MVDGYLKIKTKIDNSGVDKDISQLEDKIKKLQTDNMNYSEQESSLQKEIDKYEKLTQKADAYNQKIKEIKGAIATYEGTSIPASEFSNYENLYVQLRAAEAENKNITKEIDKQASKLDTVEDKLRKIKAKQTENNAKISEYKQKIEQINISKVENGINNVGKSLQSQIGKLGKMAMAVFGIRTAFTAVSRAVNLVKQYNSQVSTDFEYMGYCIANMIAPAVQWLTKLLYTALSYINAIMSAWFGINIFSNSSAKNFQKMKSDASSTAKSAKEIQKSLQSFDEMNVLQDNSDKSSGGNGGSVEAPSMDLSGMQGEVPKWLQWIIDNKDLIVSVLGGITAAIIALKFGLGGIKALGIGIMIAGIIKLMQDLKKYLEDPNWENFGKIIIDIGLILLGLGIIIGNVPLIIAAVIAIIIGLIVKNWEKIKEFLQKGIDWLNSKADWVKEKFGLVGEVIHRTFTAILQELLNEFDDVFSGFKEMFDGILKVFKGIFTGDMKMVLEGFKQIFKGIFDSLWGIAKAPLNLIIRGINALIRGANKIKFDIPDWVPVMGGKQFGFHISEIPLLARGTVVSRPTPAIIGEAGAEMVMPLENNLEWLDILANKLAGKIGGGSSSVNVYLDSRLIQRQVAKRQEEYNFATNR